MNNMKLGEKNISVSYFLPKNKRQNPFAKSNLYIKQFPVDWDKQKIEEFVHKTFEIYGTISSSGIFEDKNIQKKYAFVAFEEQEAASKAMAELNDYEINPEDKLYVAYAQDKATRRRTLKSKHMKFKNETNLYVKSLKVDIDEATVKKAFEKYGNVTSVCLKVHEPKPVNDIAGQSEIPEKLPVKLKFGFINFATPEEAKTAFTECKKDTAVLNCIDQNLNSRGGEFIYYAQTKTVRQQYLRMQKKNLKTFKLIQDNVLQYYQLMKYFMPNNFRNNQRPGRGGNNNYNSKSTRGGFNNYNRGKTYQTRGGQMNSGSRGGGDNQHSFNQFNHNNMMNSGNNISTPAPTQGNTPAPSGNTPAPNMMFGQDMQFGGMGMPNMGNMQAFQNQMMNNGMMGQNNQMAGMQSNVNMPMNNQTQSQPVKD